MPSDLGGLPEDDTKHTQFMQVVMQENHKDNKDFYGFPKTGSSPNESPIKIDKASRATKRHVETDNELDNVSAKQVKAKEKTRDNADLVNNQTDRTDNTMTENSNGNQKPSNNEDALMDYTPTDDKQSNAHASDNFQTQLSEDSNKSANSSFVSHASSLQSDYYPKEDIRFKMFHENHSGPFILHICRQGNSENKNSILPSHVGGILVKKYPTGIKEMYSISRNKVAIATEDRVLANKILSEQVLETKQLKIHLPFHLYSKQFLVRGIPTDIEMSDIVEFGRSANNAPILSAKRFNRRVIANGLNTYQPSMTVLITIDSKEIPQHIHLNLVRFKTEPYKMRPLQCYRCFRFGHKKVTCRSKARCFQCGEDSHSLSRENGCPNNNTKKCCANCKGEHDPTNNSCPVKIEQLRICNLAFEKQTSLDEARRLLRDSNRKPNEEEFPQMRARPVQRNVSFAEVMTVGDRLKPAMLTRELNRNTAENTLQINDSPAMAILLKLANMISEAITSLNQIHIPPEDTTASRSQENENAIPKTSSILKKFPPPKQNGHNPQQQ